MRLLLLCLSLVLVAVSQASTLENSGQTQQPIYISIIIDDIGYNLNRDRRFVDIDAPLTLAILPHTPHAVELANLAFNKHKEIMLHMPMSSVRGLSAGPGALNDHMSEQDFVQQVRKNLQAIPHIVGVNNHMGSRLTPSEPHMHWLMRELRHQGVAYYIDSMTSRFSRARFTAQQSGLPTLRRDVFLDNIKSEQAIRVQFKRMLRIARRQGYAIAIGHPYDETWSVLQQELAKLDSSVKLIPVSQLFQVSINRKPITWHASSSP
jgi:polysaccharide deacetylase 2 family uncharacterized protein YibQ